MVHTGHGGVGSTDSGASSVGQGAREDTTPPLLQGRVHRAVGELQAVQIRNLCGVDGHDLCAGRAQGKPAVVCYMKAACFLGSQSMQRQLTNRFACVRMYVCMYVCM